MSARKRSSTSACSSSPRKKGENSNVLASAREQKRSSRSRTSTACTVGSSLAKNGSFPVELMKELKQDGFIRKSTRASMVKEKPTRKQSATTTKKEKKRSSEQGDGEEEILHTAERYEMDRIVEEQTIHGITHYRVRWKGYTSKDDTWESDQSLRACGCEQSIALFKSLAEDEKSKLLLENTGENGNIVLELAKPIAHKKTLKSYESDDISRVPPPTKRTRESTKMSSDASGSPKKIDKIVHGNPEDFENKMDEGEYVVDKIIAERINPKTKGKEYKVRWYGYERDEDSWETEQDLLDQGCRAIIAKFNKMPDRLRKAMWDAENYDLGRAGGAPKPNPGTDKDMTVVGVLYDVAEDGLRYSVHDCANNITEHDYTPREVFELNAFEAVKSLLGKFKIDGKPIPESAFRGPVKSAYDEPKERKIELLEAYQKRQSFLRRMNKQKSTSKSNTPEETDTTAHAPNDKGKADVKQ